MILPAARLNDPPCDGRVFGSPSGVLILVGYHELVAVYLHLCVVPVSIVSGLEDGILQLSSTARERNAGQCCSHCRSPLWCC